MPNGGTLLKRGVQYGEGTGFIVWWLPERGITPEYATDRRGLLIHVGDFKVTSCLRRRGQSATPGGSTAKRRG